MRLSDPATRRVALAVFLMFMTVAGGSARNSGTGDAMEAMAGFLTAWLDTGDPEKAKSYFSQSPQAARLAPDRVRSDGAQDPSALPGGYWDFINDVWQPEARWRTGRDDLGVMSGVGDALVRTFAEQFGVDVISTGEDAFLAFEAGNDMSVYSFDAANKNAASVLRGSGRRTLGMLAEIPTRRHAGPFVSFWQLEADGRWRIQMVGAVRS